MKRVTIEDVARTAGVSRQTVSRAINHQKHIHKNTRKRVMDAVKELGYQPNRLAQGMVTQRTKTVGLMVLDIANPFYPEVARGVQDIARGADYNTLLCNTDDNAEEEQYVFRSLASQGVDGIIAFVYKSSDEALQKIADAFGPIVLINRDFQHPNVSTIMVDNAAGAASAIDLFVENGHRTIGMMTNISAAYNTSRRLQGYKQSVQKHGLASQPSWITGAEPSLDGGYSAAHRLLNDHPDMTALFCHNDVMALGAIRACRDLQLRVPEDVAIIGFDDVQLASMGTPALSTVHVNKYEIGRIATERLLMMLDQPREMFRPIEISTTLILRETT